MPFGGVQAVVGSFGARLGLDTTDYARGIINAQSVTQIFGQTFATFVSNPLLGSIQLFQQAGRAALGWANDVLDHAQQMSVLSRQLNVTTDFVQALRAQYEGLGQNFESSIPSIIKVVQALDQARRVGGPAGDALKEIGVDLANIATTDEALDRIINSLSRIEDPTLRAALAQRILGEQGTKLIAVIGSHNGAVGDMIAYYRQLGLVLDQDTLRSTNALKDQLGEIEQAIQGVQRSATAGFLRGFSDQFLEGTNDVEGLAEAINNKLVPAAERLGFLLAEIVGPLDSIIARIEKIEAVAGGLQDSAAFQGASWLFNNVGIGSGPVRSFFTGEYLWDGLQAGYNLGADRVDSIDRAARLRRQGAGR